MKTLRMPLAVAGLLLAAPLFAQHGVQATVPFDFFVGNSELMPSGTYRIAPCSVGSAALKIQHCNKGVTVLHLTMPGKEEVNAKGKLVFHKYGDKYFLSEVRDPTRSSSVVLPVTENEKKVQDEMATVRTYETITIPKELEEAEQPDK